MRYFKRTIVKKYIQVRAAKKRTPCALFFSYLFYISFFELVPSIVFLQFLKGHLHISYPNCCKGGR